MLAIALLTVITVSSQTPPPDQPPPLDEGEMSYIIERLDGEVMYGRALPRDVNRSKGEGKFWIDEPDPAINNRQTYQFKSCTEEFGREERWKKMVAEWHAEAGNVQTTFADGSIGWVKQTEAEWSERARNAALNVIQQREANETIALEAPAPPAVKTDEETKPGFLELWGPQLAVGVLGLVLMGVAARTLVFNSESGWQKIE